MVGNRLIWLELVTAYKMDEARSHKTKAALCVPGSSEFLNEQVEMIAAVCAAKKAHKKLLNINILAEEMN